MVNKKQLGKLFRSEPQKSEEQLKKEAARRAEREANYEAIIKATGWTKEEAVAKFKDARSRTGCRLDEYVNYKFWDMNEETQNSWCVVAVTKGMTRTFNTDTAFEKLLRSKAKTNEFLKDYIGRAYCVNTKIDRASFREMFIDSKRVFYKPMSSSWGRGAQAFVVNEETVDAVYDEIVKLPIGVVEEYVKQHDEMNRLSPTAVNTLRLVTVSSKTKPVLEDGSQSDIVYAMLKMGGATGCVDNLHGGGLGAAVDLETGILITPAVNDYAVPHNYHPVTGTKIEGFRIPFYQEAKDLAMKTIEGLGLEGYLGWDIAITNKGPVIIEINTHPGVTLLQLPYLPEKKGMRHIYDKYLIEEENRGI